MEASATNKLKSQVEKVAWIVLFWMLISASNFTHGYTTLIQFDCVAEEMNPWLYLQRSLFTGLLTGLIGGSSIVFFWEKWSCVVRKDRLCCTLFDSGYCDSILKIKPASKR